jgi:hypothetical protein
VSLEIPPPVRGAIEGFRPIAADKGWHDHDGAWSMCSFACRAFAHYCNERGLTATEESANADIYLGKAPTFTMEHRNGRTLALGHIVVVIVYEGRRIMVDWTAPQYGVMDPWPYVRELSINV